MRRTENAEGDSGCGYDWREVVSLARLARSFPIVGDVKDGNGTIRGFQGCPGG